MIRSYLDDGGAFDPEAIEAMSRAFAEICRTLKIPAGDAFGRETVAIRIIELARRGLSDPAALRDRVIQEARTAA